jgi:acyl carrier protein phosphodiesterase
MNYLAHLFLAPPTPRSQIGNLLGDFQRGLDRATCCPEIRQGILMHQKIDEFTDRHPIVQQSKQFCAPPHRRFAGIVLDVLYDHFLAKHWLQYTDIALEDFAIAVYHTLQNHQDLLPSKLQRALPDMVTNNWLCSYRDLAVVQYAIQRIGQRFKRPTPIVASYQELIQSYDNLESLFQQFFPELVVYARSIN